MNISYEYLTYLQYKEKSLSARVKAFETGEKYTKMQAAFKTQLAEKARKNRELAIELAEAQSRIVTVRQYWSEIIDDLEAEHEKELRKKDRRIKELEDRALKAERQRDEALDRITEKNRELYQLKTELEEEQGKNLKLRMVITRDYENSSIPSSMKPNHKKICNGREVTGRKQGAQLGHAGHVRARLTPTREINIPVPDKYANQSEFKPTGKIIAKQLINISLNVSVDEYRTPEFRNLKTGQRVHAEFPAGVINDVNYGGSVKSLVFLLNNNCNVSIDKTREFLSELTGNQLNISNGMINGLSKTLSGKTEAEQKTIFSELLRAPVLNTDFTNARVNGKNTQVLVCATPETPMFFAREHKGHEGIKQTPIENYQGILVHDHDKTFYRYGSGHQSCLAHLLRYLKSSIENEPNLKWNKQMRDLIRETIHYRNNVSQDGPSDDNKMVDLFEAKYSDILAIAKTEYEYEPPSKYYLDGYNLFLRLGKYMKNHLLFLRDRRVPADNNLSERLLRGFKRKQKQAISFRSFQNLDYLCRCLGLVYVSRLHNRNLFDHFANILN